MADRSGAAAATEPAAAAAASQPSSQNQRRSSRLSTDDDAELVSLAEEELPAVAQRRALDAAPVEADDYLQVRSRVSCEALKRPRKSARKSCQKNDEPARHFCAANLNLRNGRPTRPIPAVSVLIPGAFCPINHLIPPVTLNNETSLATCTPQHPQK